MPSIDIIVIGASSGGVEALKTLVHGLSPDLPAAVFIVLHVGAHPSILPDILQSVSALPVSHAIDNGRIENGNIYVAPADHHLILSLGHLHVTRGPKENNARPCVNTLFRTAAITYGNRVAGIVLTGALNDGTVGLWEIKRHGGIAIVQDPAEAPYPSMPQSALDSVQIDYVLKMGDMAPLLSKLACGSNLEEEMENTPKSALGGAHFNGLTCRNAEARFRRSRNRIRGSLSAAWGIVIRSKVCWNSTPSRQNESCGPLFSRSRKKRCSRGWRRNVRMRKKYGKPTSKKHSAKKDTPRPSGRY